MASYADHRIGRGRKLVQNIRAVLLVGSAIGESYCPKAISFVEATGTRVCLESVETNGRLQDTQRMGKQRRANSVPDVSGIDDHLRDP